MALDPAQEVDFEKALAFVLRQEGGYTNEPADHGGPTNLGITGREYDRWRSSRNLPMQPVENLTSGEAGEIYLENYWLPAHCGLLRMPASLALFDSVVNTGLVQGVKFLQRALYLAADGVVGNQTMAAMALSDPEQLRSDICDQRTAFYREIAEHPGQSVFLHGWLNRVTALRTWK